MKNFISMLVAKAFYRRETMEIEDEIPEELKMKERLVEKVQKEKDDAIRLANQERKRAEQEKQRAEQEKEQAIQREFNIKIKLAEMMKDSGKTIDEIAKETGLSPAIIRKHLFDK